MLENAIRMLRLHLVSLSFSLLLSNFLRSAFQFCCLLSAFQFSVCCPQSIVCRLLSAIYHLISVVCHLIYAVCNLISAVCSALPVSHLLLSPLIMLMTSRLPALLRMLYSGPTLSLPLSYVLERIMKEVTIAHIVHCSPQARYVCTC
jgi:hypothetical protein